MARKRVEKRAYLTPVRREQLLARCEGKCCHCGCELVLGDNFSIEHIIPLAKGGTNSFENTVALCKDCNKEKGDDVVEASFYSNAPKIVYEDISKILDAYYEEHDWLTATNVFQHDRYTINTKQSIILKNGKIFTKDAKCELKKMTLEDYETFIENIESVEVHDIRQSTDDENISTIPVCYDGQPFRIVFNGKDVAVLYCGLDAQKNRAIFRIEVTVSKDIKTWGPSSRVIIIDCIQAAIEKFRASVEAKGTKGLVMVCVDAAVNDKRAVSVIEWLTTLWNVDVMKLYNPDTNEAEYKRAMCITGFGVDVNLDENGYITKEEFERISKKYTSQLRRRINTNVKE